MLDYFCAAQLHYLLRCIEGKNSDKSGFKGAFLRSLKCEPRFSTFYGTVFEVGRWGVSTKRQNPKADLATGNSALYEDGTK